MTTKVQDIVDRAYVKIGTLAPTGVDSAIGFNTLNDMISFWNLEFITPCTEFKSLASVVFLPPEHNEVFIYNLAIKLAENKKIDLPVSVIRTAAEGLVLLSRAWAKNRKPSIAKFDFAGGKPYNITTGE